MRMGPHNSTEQRRARRRVQGRRDGWLWQVRTSAAECPSCPDALHARYLYCNGSCYIGQFMGGAAHGLGVFVSASGERYVGEWAGDKFHGNGIYKFQGGSAYAVRGCCRCPQQRFVCKLHFPFVCVLDMLLLLLTAEGAGLMEVREDGWARCVHQRQRQQVRRSPAPAAATSCKQVPWQVRGTVLERLHGRKRCLCVGRRRRVSTRSNVCQCSV